MKLRVFFIFLVVLSVNRSMAQIPEKLSYQAIIRNASDELVRNTVIGLRVGVLQGSIAEAAVYSETHESTTNVNGLLSMEIGSGHIVHGNFSKIKWENGPCFVKIEVDLNGGTNYSMTTISQLLTVPFALLAKNVLDDQIDDADADPTNEIQTLSKHGDVISLSANGGAFKDSVNTYSGGVGISIDSNLAISIEDFGTDPSIYFGNCLWPTSGILTLKNPSPNGDTRIYVMPNGNSNNNVRSAIKIFGDDFFANCDSVNLNYRDLGLYYNNGLGQFGSGAVLINNKSNGTYLGRFPETMFSFQDASNVNSVPLRFGYYDNTSNGGYESVMITGNRDEPYPLGYENLRVFHANDIGMKYNKSIRFFDQGIPANSANITMTRQNDRLIVANFEEGSSHQLTISPDFIKHESGSYLLSKKIKPNGASVADVKDTELLICQDVNQTNITQFVGYLNQRILVYGENGNTTIKNGPTIKTINQADVVLQSSAGIVEFVQVLQNKWIQVR